MPRKADPSKAIPPTTMRIPVDKLKRASKVAKKYDRSRSWLINKYIDDGLAADEKPGSLGALG